MNKSSTEQEAWPVQVFRYTTGKGWESVENAGDVDSDHAVMATPRQGCIEIRKFRVRIRLFGDQCGYASRRLDRIYCPSRSSGTTSGAIVLKFRDKGECIQFFDRLVALNNVPTTTESSRLLNNNSDKITTSRKRRMNPAIDVTCNKDDVSVKRRKFDISTCRHELLLYCSFVNQFSLTMIIISFQYAVSYVIRLLHDDSFLKFVDNIEETLMSTQDGASILAAMKHPSGGRSRAGIVAAAAKKSN